MAVFGLQQIRRYTGDQTVYLRGAESYAGGSVADFQRMPDGGYGERVTASVANRGRQPVSHPSACFDADGGLVSSSCDCGPYRRSGAPCKHIVALLTYKYYADMVAGTAANGSRRATAAAPSADKTSDLLIGGYLRALAASACVSAPHTLRLEPVLDLNGAQSALGLMIGDDRMYVIKDLSRFSQWMQSHATEQYGQLTVVHHEDAFAAESKELLRFALSLVSATDAKTGGNRFSLLNPVELSAFLRLMREKMFSVRRGEQEQTLSVEERHPLLTLTIVPHAENVTVSATPFGVWETEDGLLLLNEEGLFVTDGDYRAAMLPLLRALAGKRFSLTVPLAGFPDFCAAVLSTVMPYIALHDPEESVKKYMPPLPRVTLMMDAPSRQKMTARLRFDYPEAALHNQPAEDRITALLGRYMDATDDPALWMLSTEDDDRLFDFLKIGLPRLQKAGDVLVSDAFGQVQWHPTARAAVSVRMRSEWLEMDLSSELPVEEWQGILSAVRRKKAYHRLKNGQFLELSGGILTVASLMEQWQLPAEAIRSGRVRLPGYAAAYAVPLLRESGWQVTSDRATDEWVTRLCNPDQTVRLPATLKADLRPYQQDGFRWLKGLQECGVGGILADDMGLGKTVQMIALLLDAREREGSAPSLITCPASLVFNWQSELQRFAPKLKVITVTGPANVRAETLDGLRDADVVITSYDLLRRDAVLYADCHFRYHLADEAQYIKNDHTLNARAVKSIRSDRRFAITGTPIENRLGELWSIFDFLMPGFLSTYRRFRDRYEIPITVDKNQAAADRLRKICAPFILHRLKQEVLAELPPKQETVITVPMTEPQRKLYLANLSQAKAKAGTCTTGADRIRVLALLTRLRQICCDPSLCYEGYTGGSGKVDQCLALVKNAIAGGHKVLVFSQFTSLLERLQARLNEEQIAYQVLRGSTPTAARVEMVDRFNGDDTPVFLISLKAGGTGLNLVGADVVIHFDPWWNRSVQDQATDRAHRIGQEHPVAIYKLVCEDSIEQKMIALQEEKHRLSDVVLPLDGPSADLSPEMLRRLLF